LVWVPKKNIPYLVFFFFFFFLAISGSSLQGVLGI